MIKTIQTKKIIGISVIALIAAISSGFSQARASEVTGTLSSSAPAVTSGSTAGGTVEGIVSSGSSVTGTISGGGGGGGGSYISGTVSGSGGGSSISGTVSSGGGGSANGSVLGATQTGGNTGSQTTGGNNSVTESINTQIQPGSKFSALGSAVGAKISAPSSETDLSGSVLGASVAQADQTFGKNIAVLPSAENGWNPLMLILFLLFVAGLFIYVAWIHRRYKYAAAKT